MDNAICNTAICQNYQDALLLITSKVPNYVLDFMGGFDTPGGKSMCWRISLAGSIYWAGTLTERPNGIYIVEFRPGIG